MGTPTALEQGNGHLPLSLPIQRAVEYFGLTGDGIRQGNRMESLSTSRAAFIYDGGQVIISHHKKKGEESYYQFEALTDLGVRIKVFCVEQQDEFGQIIRFGGLRGPKPYAALRIKYGAKNNPFYARIISVLGGTKENELNCLGEVHESSLQDSDYHYIRYLKDILLGEAALLDFPKTIDALFKDFNPEALNKGILVVTSQGDRVDLMPLFDQAVSSARGE